jgi:hypothetical protein
MIVEIKRAESYKKPFAKSDFEIVEQDAKFFRIQNNHPERGLRSWATLKWRAEGTLAAKKPAAAGLGEAAQKTKTPQEQLVERLKKAGGTVEVDPPVPSGLIVNIDLHGTAITDADLAPLEEMRSLRILNLYDTQITDAGLKHLSGLTALRVLYLNKTRITDAGVQHLQGLTNLNQLALAETQVTDAGLAHLKNLTNLNELTLGGKPITDAGLLSLKSLHNLKHLTLVNTAVTSAGVEAFKKALPGVKVIQ